MHEVHRAVEYYDRAVDLSMATLRSGHPTIKYYTKTHAHMKEQCLSATTVEEVSRF